MGEMNTCITKIKFTFMTDRITFLSTRTIMSKKHVSISMFLRIINKDHLVIAAFLNDAN